MESQITTIQLTKRSKFELVRIKGELLRKDGVDRTYDDVIQELVYYWAKGIKKQGYKT